jgi:hypothetical protein
MLNLPTGPSWNPDEGQNGAIVKDSSWFDLGPLSLAVGGNPANAGNNFSWWGTFATNFFTVPYRVPHESFTQCWNRAASQTLGFVGLPSDKQMAAEVLAGATGAVGLFESIKSLWGPLGWMRPSSYGARALGAGSGGVRLARRSGKAMAVVGAAEVGLRAGAALDCAVPNNY